MNLLISSSSFICTIPKVSYEDWGFCKKFSSCGVTCSADSEPKLNRVTKGDHLILYINENGLGTTAIVTGPMNRPASLEEASWGVGIYCHGAILPFTILIGLSDPMRIPITKMIFDRTKIHARKFQK